MPIPQATVLTVNSTGHIINSWGQNLFFLPHMITVDKQNNVWVTDVALHQVRVHLGSQRNTSTSPRYSSLAPTEAPTRSLSLPWARDSSLGLTTPTTASPPAWPWPMMATLSLSAMATVTPGSSSMR